MSRPSLADLSFCVDSYAGSERAGGEPVVLLTDAQAALDAATGTRWLPLPGLDAETVERIKDWGYSDEWVGITIRNLLGIGLPPRDKT